MTEASNLVDVHLQAEPPDKLAILRALEEAALMQQCRLSYPLNLQYDPASKELVFGVRRSADSTSDKESLRLPDATLIALLQKARQNLQLTFDRASGTAALSKIEN